MSDDETTEPVPYPEHVKLQAISDQSQAIGDFLTDGGYVLAEWYHHSYDEHGTDVPEPDCNANECTTGTHHTKLLPVRKRMNAILADWFEIDEDVLEAEKRDMLEKFRAAGRG